MNNLPTSCLTDTKNKQFITPNPTLNHKLTIALNFAASPSVAPRKFATRVEHAIDNANGIWKVRLVQVLKTL